MFKTAANVTTHPQILSNTALLIAAVPPKDKSTVELPNGNVITANPPVKKVGQKGP
jgi:hypothetical protein